MDYFVKHKKEFNEISKLIEKAHNILVIPHIDPDPDSLASSYALTLALQQKERICLIGLQKKDETNKYLNINSKTYITYSEKADPPYDLIFALDIGSCNRTGKYLSLLDKGIPTINLDHHIDNEQFADINIVDSSYSSTAELVYEFLKDQNYSFTKEIATALYTGIVFDTGSFRYSLTTKKTHLIVSELLEFDIDTNKIYEELFEDMTEGALRLGNKVTSTLEKYCNGKVVLTYLRKEFYEECGATESDNSVLVKIGTSLKGVQFSIFINEKAEDLIKVSLRSKGDFKVNMIAKQFGGGGHEKAAGFRIEDSFAQVKKLIINSVIPSFSNKIPPSKN